MQSNIIKLESELKDEKNKNNFLLIENQKLKNENIQLKNQIKAYFEQQNINGDLLNEIKQLKMHIQSQNQKINSLNNFQNLNSSSNNQNNSNEYFVKSIRDKENIINDLKEKLKRFPFILEKNEKLMSVIFSSVNQKINYSIVCKNTDNIHKLEEELYKEYPNIFESRNYFFLCKGKMLGKFKTLESNHIKNGDTIIVNSNED